MFRTLKSHRIKLVISGLLILGIFYILWFPVTGGYGPHTVLKAKQSQAKVYIKNMNLAQQAYRIEYGLFTTEFSELAIFGVMPKQTNSYVYSIVPSIELDTQVMHLAVAKQTNLRSYIECLYSFLGDRLTGRRHQSVIKKLSSPLSSAIANLSSRS